MLDVAKRHVRSAIDRATHLANKKCSSRTFEVREHVYLLISPRIKFSNRTFKLFPRYCGLWRIVKTIGKVAYKLDL